MLESGLLRTEAVLHPEILQLHIDAAVLSSPSVVGFASPNMNCSSYMWLFPSAIMLVLFMFPMLCL